MQYLVVQIKAEAAKYERAVQWLADVLFHSVFERERLYISANKIVGDAVPEQRDGSSVALALLRDINYGAAEDAPSMHVHANFARQAALLTKAMVRAALPPARPVLGRRP